MKKVLLPIFFALFLFSPSAAFSKSAQKTKIKSNVDTYAEGMTAGTLGAVSGAAGVKILGKLKVIEGSWKQAGLWGAIFGITGLLFDWRYGYAQRYTKEEWAKVINAFVTGKGISDKAMVEALLKFAQKGAADIIQDLVGMFGGFDQAEEKLIELEKEAEKNHQIATDLVGLSGSKEQKTLLKDLENEKKVRTLLINARNARALLKFKRALHNAQNDLVEDDDVPKRGLLQTVNFEQRITSMKDVHKFLKEEAQIPLEKTGQEEEQYRPEDVFGDELQTFLKESEKKVRKLAAAQRKENLKKMLSPSGLRDLIRSKLNLHSSD